MLLLFLFFRAAAWWPCAKVVPKCSSILSYDCLKIFFQVRPCYKNDDNNRSFFVPCVHGSAKSNHYWGASLRTSSLDRALTTGRSGEFRPTAAAGQFQCAPNLCFEFGMQKWKTRVFILHFLNFQTLVAIIFTLRKIFETHRRPIHCRCIQHLQCW